MLGCLQDSLINKKTNFKENPFNMTPVYFLALNLKLYTLFTRYYELKILIEINLHIGADVHLRVYIYIMATYIIIKLHFSFYYGRKWKGTKKDIYLR